MFNGEIIFHLESIWGLKNTCELVVFIYMNTYNLKGRNFKTFLKENYAIALDTVVIHLLKKCWAWNWTCFDSAYGLCMY